MKRRRIHITDHAVYRYLERVKGVDMDAVRAELAAIGQPAVNAGATAIKRDGVRFVLEGHVMVTVVRTAAARAVCEAPAEPDKGHL